MKEPTTIRGYISMIRRIDKVEPSILKGYENLNKYEKDQITEMAAAISNYIGEYDDFEHRFQHLKLK